MLGNVDALTDARFKVIYMGLPKISKLPAFYKASPQRENFLRKGEKSRRRGLESELAWTEAPHHGHRTWSTYGEAEQEAEKRAADERAKAEEAHRVKDNWEDWVRNDGSDFEALWAGGRRSRKAADGTRRDLTEDGSFDQKMVDALAEANDSLSSCTEASEEEGFEIDLDCIDERGEGVEGVNGTAILTRWMILSTTQIKARSLSNVKMSFKQTTQLELRKAKEEQLRRRCHIIPRTKLQINISKGTTQVTEVRELLKEEVNEEGAAVPDAMRAEVVDKLAATKTGDLAGQNLDVYSLTFRGAFCSLIVLCSKKHCCDDRYASIPRPPFLCCYMQLWKGGSRSGNLLPAS